MKETRRLSTVETLSGMSGADARMRDAACITCGMQGRGLYTFTPRGSMRVNDVEFPRDSCAVGDYAYANEPAVGCLCAIRLDEWIFCAERAPEGVVHIVGLRGQFHFTLATTKPLKEGGRWAHVLFHWVARNALPHFQAEVWARADREGANRYDFALYGEEEAEAAALYAY